MKHKIWKLVFCERWNVFFEDFFPYSIISLLLQEDSEEKKAKVIRSIWLTFVFAQMGQGQAKKPDAPEKKKSADLKPAEDNPKSKESVPDEIPEEHVEGDMDEKPVIYLYPTSTQQVSVKLSVADATITSSYPELK